MTKRLALLDKERCVGPIYAVGSLLGGTDVKGMFQLIDEAEVQGLDVMSMGVTLVCIQAARGVRSVCFAQPWTHPGDPDAVGQD